MDGLVSRASMIRLSLHPLPASETSAFNKIRAFSTRRAGLFPFRINVTPHLVTMCRRDAAHGGCFCAASRHWLFLAIFDERSLICLKIYRKALAKIAIHRHRFCRATAASDLRDRFADS